MDTSRIYNQRSLKMNQTKFAIGTVLAGIVGPSVGIGGNVLRLWGMTVAALCFSLGGLALMFYSRRKASGGNRDRPNES